ncbi:MAG: sulfatase [Ekhidna sp.]|nr:sulfatase [Ekhidna sp.]
MRGFYLLLIGLLTGCNSSSYNADTTKDTRPNVIFIYADDLGYGDLGSYGSDSIATPYLDQMAEEGIRFTNFYTTSPICSPSRTSLLTGRYQVRTGVTRVFFPNSLQGLDTTEYTMAEMFKENGYETGLIGKWHLGHLPQFLPDRHGFDYWFGLPYSNDMEWKPRKDPPLPLMRNGKVIAQPVNQKELTQRYSAEAKYFIAKNRNKPFFMYLAHTFPHTPLHVSAEYDGTSKLGKYGDVVQELDRSVGEIFETLKEFGLDENTIVVFSSDNGPVLKVGGSAGELRGQKTTTWDGGIKVPTLLWWKGKVAERKVDDRPYIMTDWLPTFSSLIDAQLPEITIDGTDISASIFDGEALPDRDFYFYFNEELRAVRSGDWKYKRAVVDNPYRQRHVPSHEAMLFDLEKDPGELNNLAREFASVVEELEKKMDSFEKSLGQVPEPKLEALPFDDPRKKK